MSERRHRIENFLLKAGWANAERKPMDGDASFRRYERLVDGPRTAILMDAPPPMEDVRPFVLVGRHLRELGLRAPEIMAQDLENGLLILEDFGDDTYTRLLDDGCDERALYEMAVDVLIELHRIPAAQAIPDGIAPYDDERLLEEAYLLTDWYMPALFGEPTPDGVRRSYRDVWLSVFPMAHAQPRTLVLRDYHVNNLMRVAAYDGIKACGLLDFQDALAGPGAYDLMSLLEDSRRGIEMNLINDMLERYHEAFPNIDWNAFIDVFTILGAQRHAKVIGIFTRLSVRDSKPGYLTHIPRLWRLVERSFEHPRLAGLAQWMDEHIEPRMRRIPPCQGAAK